MFTKNIIQFYLRKTLCNIIKYVTLCVRVRARNCVCVKHKKRIEHYGCESFLYNLTTSFLLHSIRHFYIYVSTSGHFTIPRLATTLVLCFTALKRILNWNVRATIFALLFILYFTMYSIKAERCGCICASESHY